MIGLNILYLLAGLMFLAFAGVAARERRWANAGFQGLVALSFLAGDRIGDTANGIVVLAIAAVALSGRMRAGPHGERPRPRGNGLFAAALTIPVAAVFGTLLFKLRPDLVDPKQATLVALAAGVLIALALCYAWLRPRPAEPFVEGARVVDGIGWALVLPQMLASLGAIFAIAGVGEAVGRIAGAAIPHGSLLGAVLVYALGLAGFTIVMGNAFAAFPVMAAAVGVPLLIRTWHGDPAVVAAMGMLAGFCGTLLSPMAANFNLVPAALLELKDRYGVIRAQAATAIPLLAVLIAMLYAVGFR